MAVSGETGSRDRTETHDSPEGARAGKRAATREAIVRSALRLFAEQGFDDTTVPQIASAAGVSRATVFRYFPSKEDIVFAHSADEIQALRAALRDHPNAGVDRDEMCAALMAFVAHLELDAEGLARRFAVVHTHPQLRVRGVAIRAEFGDAIADELAAGGAPGIRERVIASAVVAALVLTVREWEEGGGRQDLRTLLLHALSTLSFDEA